MVASEKGVVVGRLTYREDGDLIDCQRMGVGGKAIPPNVDKVLLNMYLCLTVNATDCSSLIIIKTCLRTDNNCCQVTDIQSDALFILLVEKDAAFMRLAEDRFYNTYPCIILTAKGQPDVASRCVLLVLLHYSLSSKCVHALCAFNNFVVAGSF